MRIGVFSDAHISARFGLLGANERTEDGRKRSLVEAEASFEWMIEDMKAEGVDAVLFGGDLFHHANPTAAEYELAIGTIRQIVQNWNMIAILGNHSMGYAHGADALAPLRKLSEYGGAGMLLNGRQMNRNGGGLHIYDAPQIHDIAGPNETIRVFCLPYPKRGRLVSQTSEQLGLGPEVKNGIISAQLNQVAEAMAMESEANRKRGYKTVLLSHITFGGTKFNDSLSVPMTDVQVSTEFCESFDFVLGGHIHKHQNIAGLDHAIYVSPLDRWEFGDEGDPRGYVIVDTDEMGLEFREYPSARDFVTVQARELLRENRTEPPIDLATGAPSARTFARVVGEVGSIEELDRIGELIDEIGHLACVIRNDVEVKATSEGIKAVRPEEGVEAIYLSYLESRPEAIPEPKRDAVLERIKGLVDECVV